MGTRGPVPKRDDVRRRTNKSEMGPVTKGRSGAVLLDAPAADPEWHSIAQEWFLSLSHSGQSFWYEPSDWAVAKYVAEAMSRNLFQGGKMSSMMFASVMSAMSELLTTEGARRRVRMELSREEPTEDVSLVAQAEYKAMLRVVS